MGGLDGWAAALSSAWQDRRSFSPRNELIEHELQACCCYAVDENYLVPTLLSASQLRRMLPREAGDVIVVCFGAPSRLSAAGLEFCNGEQIKFILVPAALLDGAPMMCARFFLGKILEPRYRRIIYLDGDTQVVGSLRPLLDHSASPGSLLATPDPMAVMIDRSRGEWPERRRYFQSIGLPIHRQATYFNSGILRFDRGAWEAISRDCVSLCASHGSKLEFRDQDALNVVVGDQHRPISFKWNFPPFFMNFGGENLIRPHVYHFMSNPRPWHGAFAPWGRLWHAPYVEFVATHPDLGRSLPHMGRARRLKYVAQQHFKRFVESRVWGTPLVRERIADLEGMAVV